MLSIRRRIYTMRLHLSRSDFESLGVFSQNRYRYKKHSSRKLECVSFKMGYRGLPVRKHSAWDPFRRPRGLDFRVCDFTDFLALKKNYLPAQNLPPRAPPCIAHGRTACAVAITRQDG